MSNETRFAPILTALISGLAAFLCLFVVFLLPVVDRRPTNMQDISGWVILLTLLWAVSPYAALPVLAQKSRSADHLILLAAALLAVAGSIVYIANYTPANQPANLDHVLAVPLIQWLIIGGVMLVVSREERSMDRVLQP